VISSLWLKVFPPDKYKINNKKEITNGLLSAQAAFRFRVVSTLLAIWLTVVTSVFTAPLTGGPDILKTLIIPSSPLSPNAE